MENVYIEAAKQNVTDFDEAQIKRAQELLLIKGRMLKQHADENIRLAVRMDNIQSAKTMDDLPPSIRDGEMI